MTELKQAEFIRLDLFPANIEKDVTQIGYESRVIITDDMFYIFKDGESGPVVYLAESLVEFEGNNLQGYVVTTDNGQYLVVRAPSCGCGSRLRGFFPFAGVPRREK